MVVEDDGIGVVVVLLEVVGDRVEEVDVELGKVVDDEDVVVGGTVVDEEVVGAAVVDEAVAEEAGAVVELVRRSPPPQAQHACRAS